MTKKLIILSVLLVFILAGCSAQQGAVNWQEDDENFSGDYQATYDLSKIEVAIAGKKYTTSMSDIESGGAEVGEITLPKEVADKLEAELNKNFNFDIDGIAKITGKNLDKNTSRSGLYFPRKDSFLFGEVEAVDPPTENCGAIGGTAVSGKFNSTGIENGKTTIGFIAGCTPIIIGARATISWTASKK